MTIPDSMRRYGPIALPGASLVFLLFGPVGGSATDDEEYRNVVVSLVIHARAIWTATTRSGRPIWGSACPIRCTRPSSSTR